MPKALLTIMISGTKKHLESYDGVPFFKLAQVPILSMGAFINCTSAGNGEGLKECVTECDIRGRGCLGYWDVHM